MLLVAGTISRVPGLHALAGTHCAALTMSEYSPGSQFVHWRSAEVVPTAETYVPARQVIQSMHDSAFLVTLNLPDSHVEQPRSRVLVGSALTNVPAMHD